VARTVSVKLLADVAQFTAAVGGKAVGAVKDLGGELDKAAKAGKLDNTIRATAALGLGLTGMAAGAVKMSMDFEKSMSAVSAATHASAGDLGQLRAAAIQAGKDTQYSATGAADAITELSKAGVHTADILGGGLKGALDLAAAGQIDVGEAAQTAASAMTQFGLSGNQVPHIADLLAAAAGKAQGSVHDMGYALNQSGLVASQFGLSIEDTTGALAEFASAGLLGSDAGTSFKTMLLAMANPTDITKNKMDELGISFYDAQGKFIGVAGVAQVLQTRLKDLTEEQRNQALGQIFGNDAIRAASILYKDGAGGVQKWAKAVNDTGYASTTAAKLTDNLAGDLERLRGSLETVAIESGGGATGGLRKLTQGANAAVNAFADLPGWVQQSITVLSGVGGVSLLAAAGFLKARSTTKDLMDELREMGPRGTAAANGLGKLTSVAGKLGLVGAAAVGMYEGFKLFGDWLDHFSAPVVRDVDKMTASLQEFATTGKVTGELAKTFGSNLGGLKKDFQEIADLQQQIQKIGTFPQSVYAGRGAGAAPNAADLAGAQKKLAQLREDTAALDKTLAQLATNGGAAQARIAFEKLAAATGVNIDQLPQYKAAAQGAAAANTGLAKGFGDATSNAQTMTYSLESAIDAGQKLTDVWNQLNGALLSSDRADLEAKQAIDAVTKSFKENGKSVDESGQKYDKHGNAVKQNSEQLRQNSEKALKNRIAVGEAAKAAAAAAEAKYEETGSVAAANKVYDAYIGQLRRSLGQAGLTKKQIDQLIGSYGKMPPSIATKVTAPGADKVKQQMADAWAQAKGFEGTYTANVSVTGDVAAMIKLRALNIEQNALKKGVSISTSAARALAGDAKAAKDRGVFSAGGWTGPGGTHDDAGVVHADEHVIKKPSRRKLEAAKPGALDYMNQTGQWPGYVLGGHATMTFPTNVSKTKIPQISFSAPGGGGGPGYKWMEAVVHAAFPGMPVYSDYRPGAITITGNRSYHGFGRAVDFAPSKPLAQWINAHYMRATKELITPWQSLNIHNGSRHTYSALVEGQHNFAGGNAHDHWAMANGGVINEPVFGYGLRSGDTYSFGERGRETVTPGVHSGGGKAVVNINMTVNVPLGAHANDVARDVSQALERHLSVGGEIRVNGKRLLGAS
jgi:TP901 family phage tail tape measure protein